MKDRVMILLFGMLLVQPAFAEDGCVLIQSWSDVPLSISQALTIDIGVVAERGGEFNASDIVLDETPRNRFFWRLQIWRAFCVGN